MSKKIFIPIVTILTLILLSLGILAYTTLNQPNSVIINETNNSVKLSGDRASKIKGGWQGYIDEGSEITNVLTKFDLFNPVYTNVYKVKGSNTTRFKIINLTRKDFFNFEVSDYTFASTEKQITFDEALALAKQYDLSKYNPDPANIIINPAPSREQVEKSKKLNDINNQLKDNVEYNNAINECVTKYRGPDQDICFNEQQLKFYKP